MRLSSHCFLLRCTFHRLICIACLHAYISSQQQHNFYCPSSLAANKEQQKEVRVHGMPQGMPVCHESPEPLVGDPEATPPVAASQGMRYKELLQLAGRQQHVIQLCVPHHGLHEQGPSPSFNCSLSAEKHKVCSAV